MRRGSSNSNRSVRPYNLIADSRTKCGRTCHVPECKSLTNNKDKKENRDLQQLL